MTPLSLQATNILPGFNKSVYMIRLMLVPLLRAIRRGVTLLRTKLTRGHKHRRPLTPGQLLGLIRARWVSS